MDIEILNDTNKLQRPWLTIVIDDCSRAICGYELSFLSPSAYKTSLCLRHAIWRKADHCGSDFLHIACLRHKEVLLEEGDKNDNS